MSVTAGAELYDRIAGTFSSAGTMVSPRAEHTATLAPDGRVVLCGGTNGSQILDSAEFYNPATNTFTAVSTRMSTPRKGHVAVLSGTIIGFVSGTGDGVNVLTSMDSFNSAPMTFFATAAVSPGRAYASASINMDGTMLIAGGSDGTSNRSDAAFWNGNVNFLFDTMSVPRAHHTSTAMLGGRILIAGGETIPGSPTATADLYDRNYKTRGTLSSSSTLRVPRTAPAATGYRERWPDPGYRGL